MKADLRIEYVKHELERKYKDSMKRAIFMSLIVTIAYFFLGLINSFDIRILVPGCFGGILLGLPLLISHYKSIKKMDQTISYNFADDGIYNIRNGTMIFFDYTKIKVIKVKRDKDNMVSCLIIKNKNNIDLNLAYFEKLNDVITFLQTKVKQDIIR